jgi:hypothetical protein
VLLSNADSNLDLERPLVDFLHVPLMYDLIVSNWVLPAPEQVFWRDIGRVQVLSVGGNKGNRTVA